MENLFVPYIILPLIMIHEKSWTWIIFERIYFKALAIWFNCFRPICFKDQGTLWPKEILIIRGYDWSLNMLHIICIINYFLQIIIYNIQYIHQISDLYNLSLWLGQIVAKILTLIDEICSIGVKVEAKVKLIWQSHESEKRYRQVSNTNYKRWK